MSVSVADWVDTSRPARGLLPVRAGAGAYLLLLLTGDTLLQDSDTFWQIRIGQWIIDGRAELYGEKFVWDYFNAVDGRDVNQLKRLLNEFQIDATLLVPDSPAAQLLDYLPGWKRLYADDIAVIHVTADRTEINAASTPEISN